ncbi:MAG TPA: hypothetical protein VLS96_22075 [Nodosilinea sp.]|nr:hypothetical protein [Nodosilinea sp.]
MSATLSSTGRRSNRYYLELNQVRACDRAVHNWYRFVLSYPPHLVQEYAQRFGLSAGHQLLDPFCGTGTTVVEGKKLGIPSVGIEANPMAQFAAAVKLDWSPQPDQLRRLAEAIGTATEQSLGQTDTPLRTLPADSERLLLANSISPLPLHKTLVLLDTILAQAPPTYARHLQLALAKAAITTIGNLRFGPEVGVGKAKADAPVIEAWQAEVEAMAADLAALQAAPATPATVHHGDARQVVSLLPPHSIDAVITSPPYPNEKDYTRTTRLESVLLGFLQNRGDLRLLKEGLLRSNTRNVYTADRDDRWVAHHADIQRIAADIDARRADLGKTSGFSRLYSRAVKLYFGGMAKHLADLRYVLRPGAQLAYVVGDQKSYLQVMIRTGELLADLAQRLGYEVVGLDLFRTRLASTTQEQMREEVLLLRWSGVWPTTPYPFSDESP